MSGRRRALLALWGTAGLLAAPWAIEYVVRRAQHTPWRQPAIPYFRFDTPRRPA